MDPHPLILAAGVDTLSLTWSPPAPRGAAGGDRVSACAVGGLPLSVERRLEEQRVEAEERRRAREAPPVQIELAGRLWNVSHFARPPFRWMLNALDGDHILTVAPNERPKGAPLVRCESSAHGLWSAGWDGWVRAAREAAREVTMDPETGEAADIVEEHVARMDLAADVQGIDFRGTDEENGRLLCRARPVRNAGVGWLAEDGDAAGRGKATAGREWRRRHGRPGERFTGYSIGAGDVIARVYLKTLEIAVNGKAWMREVWARQPGYDPAAAVWRVEVQLRRGALRELGVTAFEPDKLDALWAWFARGRADDEHAKRRTAPWLSLRVRNGSDRNRSRWDVHPWWLAVGDARFVDYATPAVRRRRVVDDLEMIIRQGLGSMVAAARLLGLKPVNVQHDDPSERGRLQRVEDARLVERVLAELRARVAPDDFHDRLSLKLAKRGRVETPALARTGGEEDAA